MMWPTMAHTDADLVKDNLAQARPSGHTHNVGQRHRGTEATTAQIKTHRLSNHLVGSLNFHRNHL
jgi:hypothetical protein